MSSVHPIRQFCADLEAARIAAVEAASAQGVTSAPALSDLATLQAALTAVRQTIEEHGDRLGWGGDEDKLEQAAREARLKG